MRRGRPNVRVRAPSHVCISWNPPRPTHGGTHVPKDLRQPACHGRRTTPWTMGSCTDGASRTSTATSGRSSAWILLRVHSASERSSARRGNAVHRSVTHPAKFAGRRQDCRPYGGRRGRIDSVADPNPPQQACGQPALALSQRALTCDIPGCPARISRLLWAACPSVSPVYGRTPGRRRPMWWYARTGAGRGRLRVQPGSVTADSVPGMECSPMSIPRPIMRLRARTRFSSQPRSRVSCPSAAYSSTTLSSIGCGRRGNPNEKCGRREL